MSADGIGRSVDVGLWRDNGDPLASVTVTNSSSPVASNGLGEWLFEDIPQTVLTPGLYAVGHVFFNTEPIARVGPTFTTIPEVSFVEARTTSLGTDSGLTFLDTNFPLNVFGPNLRIGAVPEPSSTII